MNEQKTRNILMKDRYRGCLVGVAVGDALGAPVEFLTSTQIKENYGKVIDYVKALPKHPFHSFNPGQYTDDTQLTLILAQSIIDNNGFNQEDFGSKLGNWYKKKDFRSLGPACRTACRALSKGKSPKETGVYDAAGVGSAMRASPLGLFHNQIENPGKHQRNSLLSDCTDSTRLTHESYTAIAATTAVAASITYLKKNNLDKPNEFLESLSNFVGHVELINRRKEEIMTEDGLYLRIKNIIDLKDIKFEKGIKRIGNSGYSLEAVPAAIYAFIKSPNDFETTVLNAVNAGGDADSITSIAGALSGTYNGIEGIPKRFKEGLENIEGIISLADQLYERSINQSR